MMMPITNQSEYEDALHRLKEIRITRVRREKERREVGEHILRLRKDWDLFDRSVSDLEARDAELEDAYEWIREYG